MRLHPAQGEGKSQLGNVTSFLKSRGASVLQLPERVELVRKIPLTKIGKADKKALQEDIRRRILRENRSAT